jgi:hypothetical protein
MVVVRAELQGDTWLCRVTVDHSGQRTRHLVTVTRRDVDRWAQGTDREDIERLVEQSFDFLLKTLPHLWGRWRAAPDGGAH